MIPIDATELKKPNPFLIKDENMMVAGTDERKAELITNYFESMFAPNDTDHTAKEYPPVEMNVPFTGDEIHKAGSKLKNGKSGDGPDTLHAEFIKYVDMTVTQSNC